ncbi:MAG TPA: hypothetical protein VLG12_04015 [Candidatus Saccharimonadales bacterium]|nr:hypothetical protein [Candidatus Saccharimonadales bacterium]
MRQKQRVKYLQKPKRIRKNKKDFLRGNREIVESKVHYDNTIIPLPYVLLFSLLAATIIGYTSITFLFERIHVDVTPLLSFIKSSLSAIHIPHITIPTITIPMPHIPTIPTPSIDVSPLLELAMQNTAIISLHVILTEARILIPAFAGMTRVVAKEIVSTTTHFLTITITWTLTNLEIFTIQAITTAQINATSLAKSIHPVQIMQAGISAFGIVVLKTLRTIGNGSVWIYAAFGGYLVLIGNILSASGIFLLHAAIIVGMFLLQAVVLSVTKLIEITGNHLTLLLQTTETTILFVFQEITIFLTLQWKILIYITTVTISSLQAMCMLLLHGIISLFQGILYILESILTFIVSILVIIFDWIVSVIMAIKRGIDNTLGAIAAFIHLGDPLYRVIGSSINDLFSSMGATASITGKAVEGGKL